MSNIENIDRVYDDFKKARKELRKAVRTAKKKTWTELITTIDEDSWGKLYKIVLRRLRPFTPSVCETLGREIVDRIVNSLFSRNAWTIRTMSTSGTMTLRSPQRN